MRVRVRESAREVFRCEESKSIDKVPRNVGLMTRDKVRCGMRCAKKDSCERERKREKKREKERKRAKKSERADKRERKSQFFRVFFFVGVFCSFSSLSLVLSLSLSPQRTDTVKGSRRRRGQRNTFSSKFLSADFARDL